MVDKDHRHGLAHSIDLEERLCFGIFRFGQLPDPPVVLFDLHRHIGNLLEHRSERSVRLGSDRARTAGEAERRRSGNPMSAGLCPPAQLRRKSEMESECLVGEGGAFDANLLAVSQLTGCLAV